MTAEQRSAYVTREEILNLLSSEEIAGVSTAEDASHLHHGEEYLDLMKLEQGVRRADGIAVPMGHVLPRIAVNGETWKRILARLAAQHPTPRGPSA